MVERLGLPSLDHGIVGLNLAEGEILSEPKRHFIAQSLSLCPDTTELLLKGM